MSDDAEPDAGQRIKDLIEASSLGSPGARALRARTPLDVVKETLRRRPPDTLHGVVPAPWSPDQVESLNGYQERSYPHPFTCPREHAGGGSQVLVALASGWRCPGWQPYPADHAPCGYYQGWAYGFMADGTWREHAAAVEAALSGVPGQREGGTGD